MVTTMQVASQCECNEFKTHEDFTKNDENINPDLKALVQEIARKEGFTNYKVRAKKLMADGNSFLGLLTEVTIHNTVNNKNLNLFIKSIMPNAAQLKLMSVKDVYCTEVYFYLELSKQLEKLQDDAAIPLEERYTFIKSYKESNAEHIILENMNKRNFGTWSRFEVISLDFAEKAINLLAKFHALGFVLQEKKHEYYDRLIKPIKYPMLFNDDFLPFYNNMADNVLSYLEGSARYKFEKVYKDLFKKGKSYIDDRQCTLTMCHGDYRPNNILIKQMEGAITDMIPVDYQALNHGSPIVDIMYFIFGATDKEFRRKHLDHLKDMYHDTMKRFLEYFGMDVEKFFPKEEYERIFKERLDLGLFYGFWYLQSNLTKDEIVDLSKMQVSEIRYARNELAKIRIQELVDDFIEWGYL